MSSSLKEVRTSCGHQEKHIEGPASRGIRKWSVLCVGDSREATWTRGVTWGGATGRCHQKSQRPLNMGENVLWENEGSSSTRFYT